MAGQMFTPSLCGHAAAGSCEGDSAGSSSPITECDCMARVATTSLIRARSQSPGWGSAARPNGRSAQLSQNVPFGVPYALLHQVCCPMRPFRGHRRKPPSSSEERREVRVGGGPFLLPQMCLTQRSGRVPRCRTRSSPVVVASGRQPQGITPPRSEASQQRVAACRSVP